MQYLEVNERVMYHTGGKVMGYELESSADCEVLYLLGAETVEMSHIHLSSTWNSALEADELLLAETFVASCPSHSGSDLARVHEMGLI